MVEDRVGGVGVDPARPRKRRLEPERESRADEGERKQERPPRPPPVEHGAGKPEQHDRHEVEEVAVEGQRAETGVVAGHLDRDRDDRHRADRGERSRVEARSARGEAVREQPGEAGDERQDPEREGGLREMPEDFAA